jgi:hypothetical protein
MSKFNNPWDIGGEYWGENALFAANILDILDLIKPSGKITFKGFTETELKDFRIIPESKKRRLIEPVVDKTYTRTDGFYAKKRPDGKNFFKVKMGAIVVTPNLDVDLCYDIEI